MNLGDREKFMLLFLKVRDPAPVFIEELSILGLVPAVVEFCLCSSDIVVTVNSTCCVPTTPSLACSVG